MAAAVAIFERALALTPPGHEARPHVLVGLADAVGGQARAAEAVTLLEEAVAAFRSCGDDARADAAEVDLARALNRRGDWKLASSLAVEVVARLQSNGPSETLARAMGLASRSDDYLDKRKTEQEEQAIAMAAELGLVRLHSQLIAQRGLRRVNTGDLRGMTDLRTSFAQAVAAGDREHVAHMYYWLGSCMGFYDDPDDALTFVEEGLAFSRRHGFRNYEVFLRQDRWGPLFRLGRWSEILDDVEAQIREAGPLGLDMSRTMTGKIVVLSLTGHPAEAARLALEDPDVATLSALYGAQRSRGLRAEAKHAAAAALLEDACRQLRADDATLLGNERLDLVREAIALGRIDLAESIASMRTIKFSIDDPAEELSVTAVLAEVTGRPADVLAAFRDAGRTWQDLRNPYQTAMAALGEGRCLLALGRHAEAAPVLRQAQGIFERLGATPAFAEADALLATIG